MPIRFFLIALLALLLLPLTGCPGGGDLVPDDDDSAVAGDDDDSTEDVVPTSPVPITLTTSDGLELRGTFQAAPGVTLGPAVVMLHELGGTRVNFNLAWDNFLDQGISVLAFDFRGHGQSDDGTVALADLRTTPDQLELDLRAALDYVADQAVVDPTEIGVIGLDVGANLAIVARHGSADWGVASIVAISPDIVGVEALGELSAADLVLSNVQYVAGANNAPDAADAQALYDGTTDPRDLRLVKQSSSHGADLLTGSSDAQEGVATWFATRFSE
jgi:pimeloyl-ACP methyl ester carboxylesterase